MKKIVNGKDRIVMVLFILIMMPVLTSFEKNKTKSASDIKTYDFIHQYISQDLPTVQLNGAQTLADYDNDGDLDMTIGSLGYGLYLMKNNGSSWQPIRIGNLPYTALGAVAMDLNSDGWIDIITAAVWYENNLGNSFTMHTYDSKFKTGNHFHDIIAADMNNDGKKDIIGMGDDIGFFWYNVAENPVSNWNRITIDPSYPDSSDPVHGGFSPSGAGDLDGDGDNDIFRANVWFENKNDGLTWVKHPVTFSELFTGSLPYGKSTRSIVIDIDNDGDNDIVFSTCDDVDGKIGIMENTEGDGSNWKLNLFPETAPGRRGSLHSLRVADFDMDGKLDVLTADQEDMIQSGMPSPRWYIFYQTENGWVEQVLFDIGLGSHEIFAQDVDQDGDYDIVGKNWYPWSGNATYGTSHADYFENLQIIQNHNAVRLSTYVNTAWSKTGGKWDQLGDYIVGGQDLSSSEPGGLLLTKQKFGDCEMVCDVWPDYGVDSGIFLRTSEDGKKAYQVTIDYQEDNPMGGIYLSGMDASSNWDFTIKNEDSINGIPQYFNANAWPYIWKKNDWNQFRVRIENNPPTITTWINGWKIYEYTDSQIRLADDGMIGLQVHTGNDWAEGKVVRFKNIKIYPLTPPVNEILKDTIAKINFTETGILENGWMNVAGTPDFPISVGNGITVSTSGSTLLPGNQGEPITIFPTNVGKSYCSVNATDTDPVRIKTSGLNPGKKYNFEIFASRDNASSNETNKTFFSIGTDTVSINPVGNTDSVLTISEIIPDEAGEIVLSITKPENQTGYINALIVSRLIDKAYSLSVEKNGNGTVSQSSGSYEEGTNVTLTATPDDGWMFEKWGGDMVSIDPTITVNMNSDKYLIATFTEIPDPNTIAKINFTWDATWDVEGWKNVYGSSSFPVNLGNGVVLYTSGGNLAMGISGEPTSTVVPDKVSNTYNWLSNLDNTPVDILVTGLDTQTKYKFSIFASRDGNTASGDRTTTYSITGTDKTVSINPVGNKDSLLVINNITPSSGTVVLHISQQSGQYGYINALIITKEYPTSINESRPSDEIRYYPVPVSDKLHITNLPAHNQISVYDLTGNKILDKQGDTNQDIVMNDFNPGIYLFRIVSPFFNEAKCFKVIKR